MEVSIGDYVISGGELAAMVLIDSMGRQVKGVLGNSKSTQDSFFDGNLEYPQYSRPEEIDGQKVPEVLLSGHQKNIDIWRDEHAKLNTSSKRKDLLNKTELD
jgi:tRNA (guanine37-N1)-methyltransferase